MLVEEITTIPSAGKVKKGFEKTPKSVKISCVH